MEKIGSELVDRSERELLVLVGRHTLGCNSQQLYRWIVAQFTALTKLDRNFSGEFNNVIFIVNESGLSDGVLTVITHILHSISH